MSDIHFLRPNFFILILPFAILFFLLFRSLRSINLWQKICSPDLIPFILTEKPQNRMGRLIPLLLTLSLLIGALAGPAWRLISVPLIQTQTGLVIALDLSVAMNADDVKPSRLQRSIYKINDILKQRHEGETALIVFSGEPFVVTPLTDDIATITSLLPVLEPDIMPSNGQEVNKAIRKASELLTQAGISNGTILLVTAELSSKDMEKALDIAKSQGVKISVLGVGGENALPIPVEGGGFVKNQKGDLVVTKLAKENLSHLASSTGGLYKTMTVDDSDIETLSSFFSGNPLGKDLGETEIKQNQWQDEGYLLVLIALPFAAALFRRGILLTLLIFFIPYHLNASIWDNLWKTPDQKGEELFQKNDYQQAKEMFQNRDWQAAASYKLGEYETSAELFKESSSADGLYNYGTAQAKLGDFKEALSAYEKVLALDPDHEDAKYNKQLIEDLQKQEEQNNDQNNPDDDKKENQNQKDKQNSQSSKDDSQEKETPDQNQQDDQEKQNQSQDQKQNSSQDQNNSPKNDNENPSDQNQKEMEKNYSDQLNKELEQEKAKSPEKPKNTENGLQKKEGQDPKDEQRQIDERWLQKVKDDPGGLLRRKFYLQYQQQNQKK